MNDSRLFKVKKVEDIYNNEGMELQASYEAISAFEESNGICASSYSSLIPRVR